MKLSDIQRLKTTTLGKKYKQGLDPMKKLNKAALRLHLFTEEELYEVCHYFGSASGETGKRIPDDRRPDLYPDEDHQRDR